MFKIDQVVNGNHRFFTRFVRNKRTEINDPAGFPVEASPWYQHGRMNVGVSGEATSVLSPSVVLNSRVGFIRHDFYIQLHGDGVDPSTLGFPSSYASQVARQTFPQINYEGYSAFGSGRGGASQFTISDTWSWSETLSMTRGTHSLKFGGEFRVMVNDQQNPTSSSGNYTFNRNFTRRNVNAADVDSGNGLATMLLGYASDTSFVPINPRLDYRNNYYGIFLQDDWRMTDKLTVNLGLRWTTESPIAEAANQQNIGFDADAVNPFVVPGMQLHGGLLFASESDRLPFVRDLNNWQPRAGAAYRTQRSDGHPRRVRAQLPADVRHRVQQRLQRQHGVRCLG